MTCTATPSPCLPHAPVAAGDDRHPQPVGKVDADDVDSLGSGGSAVYSSDQHLLGTLEQIFAGPDSAPAWLTVATDARARRAVLVPVIGAQVSHGDMLVAYTADQFRHAPTVCMEDDLTRADTLQASAHYPPTDHGTSCA